MERIGYGKCIDMDNHGQHGQWIFRSLPNLGVSENVVYPIVPNGFADHYPVFKWLAIIGNINPTFSDKPTWETSKVGGLPSGRSREQDGRAIGGQCGSRRGCELQEGHLWRQKRGKEGQEEGAASNVGIYSGFNGIYSGFNGILMGNNGIFMGYTLWLWLT